MVVGMSDAVARHRHAAERLAWYEAAKRGGKAVVELLDSWGESDKTTWYATNSREGVRDETFPAWRGNGALLLDESVPATSSRGRYSLAPDFAKLLDPALAGDDLTQRVREWQDRNLTMTARLRAQRARDAVRAGHAIAVTLPGGGSRKLLPGQSSVILKGVIEEWTKMLDDPDHGPVGDQSRDTRGAMPVPHRLHFAHQRRGEAGLAGASAKVICMVPRRA
jgi:hypothetical protein